MDKNRAYFRRYTIQ